MRLELQKVFLYIEKFCDFLWKTNSNDEVFSFWKSEFKGRGHCSIVLSTIVNMRHAD